jgi:transcriptional regulator GlxA family with amidase domain
MQKYLILPLLYLFCCAPFRQFHTFHQYAGLEVPERSRPSLDPNKKTVMLVASPGGTEVLDLLAPYEILSRAGVFNVVLVSPTEAPISLWGGAVVLPQYTFAELALLSAVPDAIVLPNIEDEENPMIRSWLREMDRPGLYYLSICEGARIAAESGLFEGKRITTHSSALKSLAKKYPGLSWVGGVRVEADGYFLSTTGVSAAIDGALLLVAKLSGDEVCKRVEGELSYSRASNEYKNQPLGLFDKTRIARQVLLRRSPRIAVRLEGGVSELQLAALLDVYARTFPQEIHTVSEDGRFVRSQFGLWFGPTAKPQFQGEAEEVYLPSKESKLPLEVLGERLQEQYSKRFTRIVMKMLDYPAQR